MEKVYKTAIYLRISRDEEAEKESGSISNQREMLMSFIESRSDLEFLKSRDDLEFCGEYSDESVGGYDFDRPQFQQMISDVKKGKINCIVVKDFSHLGRNFLRIKKYSF